MMIFCRDSRLVNNRFLEAVSTHRAFCFHSTIARSWRHDLLVQNGFVVTVLFFLSEVWHATVADLDVVSVKDLM